MDKGSIIKRLREKMGYSQVDLANRIGVSKQLMYKYENNIITNIPSEKVEVLAKELHTIPAVIMGWEDPSIVERDSALEYISIGLISQGYDLDCNSFDDSIFIIRTLDTGRIVSILSDAALLKRYGASHHTNEPITVSDLIALSVISCSKEGFDLTLSESRLLDICRLLNAEGQKKVLTYAEDLSDNKNYIASPSPASSL